ncbi:MAG TPA: transglutaminaseTgpA domain-containing protein [Candidatus Acidoferrales bacterium]|nr:transglutaminaseTgpA domain-containing protein [Candidatus Acidoferrales bacterium]
MSAALCAALLGATSWAVLAAGWAQNSGGAVVVAVAATIEAALLARAAVARWVAVLLAPILALAAIIPTTLGAMPFDGNASLGHAVGRYASALTSGLAATADWPFTVGLCAVLWLCGFWVGWLAIRERRGILAVVPIYAVLATNVLNTRLVDNVALPEALAVFFSLLLVADAHLDSLQARWSSRSVISLPGMRSRFAGSVVVMSVVLTLAALLIPSISSADISARFFGGNGTNGRDLGGHPIARAPASAGTIQFNGATQPGGALTSQPQPVLTYTVDSTSPAYLRVITDTQFAGGNWYPSHVGDTAGAVTWDGLQFPGGALPRDRNLADGATSRAVRTVHSVIVMQADATGNSALTPFVGEPDTIDQAGIAYGVDNSGSTSLLTVDSVQLDAGIDPGTTVVTSGFLSTASVAQLRTAGTGYPAFVRPYTDLRDDFTQGAAVITQLAQAWTAGLTNPYDQATAIEAHFRNPSFFTYTLNPPAVPPNVWPIVYFLSTGHRGYCQYFAASMGAMLRSLGIPTRLVNGYGPGTTQVQNGHPGVRQQLVTTSDAHTWVEAYFPSYGWIPFEPTPPSADGGYVPFTRGPAAATNPGGAPGLPSPPSDVKPGFNDPSGASGSAARSLSHGPSPLLVLGAIAGTLLLALIGFATWLLLPRSLPGAWRRLETMGAVWGMRRRPWETHRDYVERFDTAPAPVAASLGELARLLGRAEFSRDGVDRAASKRAITTWRKIFVALPRLTWTFRRRRFEPA